ncbi:alpha/beta-Hydrolases superfamily protein [Striga asiatica]|uniref:Alpha/beta-Hydrolases superfamily protein n=1 Tax=Striga asiatica TaxID=4170 RepID=A0A5A7PPH8_STRAF|nr:alpha/beta-Hydrolases superfamily protein [Striga asiatica]
MDALRLRKTIIASRRSSTAYSTTTTCCQHNEREGRYTPYSRSAASDQHRHGQGYLRHRLLGATMLRPPSNTFRASALPADLRCLRPPSALPAGEDGQEICPEEDGNYFLLQLCYAALGFGVLCEKKDAGQIAIEA